MQNSKNSFSEDHILINQMINGTYRNTNNITSTPSNNKTHANNSTSYPSSSLMEDFNKLNISNSITNTPTPINTTGYANLISPVTPITPSTTNFQYSKGGNNNFYPNNSNVANSNSSNFNANGYNNNFSTPINSNSNKSNYNKLDLYTPSSDYQNDYFEIMVSPTENSTPYSSNIIDLDYKYNNTKSTINNEVNDTTLGGYKFGKRSNSFPQTPAPVLNAHNHSHSTSIISSSGGSTNNAATTVSMSSGGFTLDESTDVLALSKDQFGCRFLQKKLDDSNHSKKNFDIIFNKIYMKSTELMIDPFGNYLIQKIFNSPNCDSDELNLIIGNIKPFIFTISKNQHGTRAIQRLIDVLKTDDNYKKFQDALKPYIINLIQDLNGNHVIQKCLNKFKSDPADLQFIVDCLIVDQKDNLIKISTHKHGCCVLQKLLINLNETQKFKIIKELTNSYNCINIVKDQFGNYVIQFLLSNVLTLTSPQLKNEMNRRLINTIVPHFTDLSCQKFSSNVIEKILLIKLDTSLEEQDPVRNDSATPTEPLILRQNPLFKQLINPLVLSKLIKDQYGNYVIQTGFEICWDYQIKLVLIELINPLIPQIKNLSFGKRIINKIMEFNNLNNTNSTASFTNDSLVNTTNLTSSATTPLASAQTYSSLVQGNLSNGLFTSPFAQLNQFDHSFGNLDHSNPLGIDSYNLNQAINNNFQTNPSASLISMTPTHTQLQTQSQTPNLFTSQQSFGTNQVVQPQTPGHQQQGIPMSTNSRTTSSSSILPVSGSRRSSSSFSFNPMSTTNNGAGVLTDGNYTTAATSIATSASNGNDMNKFNLSLNMNMGLAKLDEYQLLNSFNTGTYSQTPGSSNGFSLVLSDNASGITGPGSSSYNSLSSLNALAQSQLQSQNQGQGHAQQQLQQHIQGQQTFGAWLSNPNTNSTSHNTDAYDKFM